MREFGRNFSGVALIPHDEVKVGVVRRSDHLGSGRVGNMRNDAAELVGEAKRPLVLTFAPAYKPYRRCCG